MTNRKSTKRALLGSVMAMVLCLAMLVGATFAWFTDTASTGVNKIQAGKLDVALEMKDAAGQWVPAEGKTLDFVKAADAKGEAILWEPGCTYTLSELRVVNNGNLALKYKVTITGINGSAKLNEAIEWTIGDVAMGAEQHLAAGESNAFTIKGHMKESAGNEYMNESIDGIAITVVATQDTVESDSFDKDYDAGAEYPVVAVANVNTNGDTVLKDKEEDHTIQVTVPAGALDEGVQSLKLEVVKSATPAGVQVASTESSQSYEVTMKDQSGNAVSTNGTLMTVEMNVGKNRTALKLYHDGEKMTKDNGTLTDAADHYVYDAATGYVTMKVSHFSPFTAVFARDYWTDHAADGYATPVDTADKAVTVSSAEELALLGMPEDSHVTFYKGEGCPECHHSGYTGRRAAFEILMLSGRLRRLISEGASEERLTEEARKSGFRSMRESCRRLVLEGVTSAEEAARIINTTVDE